MPLDSEPKNGDYAAYIETLSRRGASPGQTLRELDSHIGSRHGTATAAAPVPRSSSSTAGTQRSAPYDGKPGQHDAGYGASSERGRGWNDMPSLPTPATQGGGFGTPDAGAAPYTPYIPSAGHTSNPTDRREAERQQRNAGSTAAGPGTLSTQSAGLMQSVFLIAAGVVAGLIGLGMILSDLDDPVGGVFLIFMASLLIRAGRSARRKAGTRLAKLPPLSTVSTRKRSG